MNPEAEYLNACETHSVGEIRTLLDAGLSPTAPIRGKLPIDWLTEMYTRSDAFPACLRLLLARGAVLADPRVESVLLNDAVQLQSELKRDAKLVHHRTTMVSCFTPLVGATLLHVAAEYGHMDVARVLIAHGADVNARAAVDEFGMNGHSPLFHTVNANANRSRPIMDLLLDAGADATVKLDGITWGKGFEWETTFFDVTPISYAQMGLLPQVHRKEADISSNIEQLLKAAKRTVPPLPNIPNRYLYPQK